MLADAKQVKNLPGRPKRDPADSRWLAACFERGAVTACFVATPEFRIIRLHTRYRRDLTEERTREKQRAEKLLDPRRSGRRCLFVSVPRISQRSRRDPCTRIHRHQQPSHHTPPQTTSNRTHPTMHDKTSSTRCQEPRSKDGSRARLPHPGAGHARSLD